MIFRTLWRLWLLIAFSTCAFAGPRDAEWKAVRDAEAKALPRSAIEQLQKIEVAALADKAHAEAVRALIYKLKLEASLAGTDAVKTITQLQTATAASPEEIKPIMEAVLARWYWNYFQRHRYQFARRTQQLADQGVDIASWDLARILREIDSHFTAALSKPETLQQASVEDYDEILEKGSVPDTYRPTLYDFIAYEALTFYQAGEHAGTREENAFDVTTESPIFASAAEFLNWRLEPAEAGSPAGKAIALYQSLLRFHEKDADRSAFFDADLARILYGRNVAVGPEKSARVEAELTRFIEQTQHHEISARALAHLAGLKRDQDDPATAHQLADRGRRTFPRSAGAAQCENLIREIESRQLSLDTETVWNAPWPTLNIHYRNITEVHFRAVPVNFRDYLEDRYRGRRDYLKAKPAHSWSAKLPPTTDFKERTEATPSPTVLKPGFYVVIASHRSDFGDDDNAVSITPVWVSDLALVIKPSSGTERGRGFVLNARTGEPCSNATVEVWERDDRNRWKAPSELKTNGDGEFSVAGKNRQVVFVAKFKGQEVANIEETYLPDDTVAPIPEFQAVLFTDRSIYRPGQSIFYKGIALRADQNSAEYATLPHHRIKVLIRDTSGREIATESHTTNDYGSFSGVFTAPTGQLTGSMMIQVHDTSASAWVRVEEYKRPKFQVSLEAGEEAPKLGETVKIKGKALAYTGSAIDSGKVTWRVVRNVRFPYWCWWIRPLPSQAIAHGKAITNADGTFELEFVATPDRSAAPETEPVFSYSVYADVTDLAGETRSNSHTVSVGYTALQAHVSADAWLTTDKPVELTILTSTLDGVPQKASGTVEVFALIQPDQVSRAELQTGRYRHNRTQVEGPSDASNPDFWEVGERVFEAPFSTDETGNAKVAYPLLAGAYRAVLKTKDRFSKDVTARTTLQIIDLKANALKTKVPDLFRAPKWSLAPGDTFTAVWGTGYQKGRARITLSARGKTLKTFWTEANSTQQLIQFPVTEELRGGFTASVLYVRENRAYVHEQIVDVPWDNKKLTVKWDRFRSKLEPGKKETWTATISGPDAEKHSAEVVAALYDASLDQFAPHSWPAQFAVFRTEGWIRPYEFQNQQRDFQNLEFWRGTTHVPVDWSYRRLPAELTGPQDSEDVVTLSPFMIQSAPGRGLARRQSHLAAAAAPADAMLGQGGVASEKMAEAPAEIASQSPVQAPNLDQVSARKNLNETAFFFPHLTSDRSGVVRMEFTVPEALTEWKFLGFAHDNALRSGFLTDKTVTAKDLMVQPNAPRFLREGDIVEFSVKVTNQAETPQKGSVRLSFTDPVTNQSRNEALGVSEPDQTFSIPAKQSRSFTWRIKVPDGAGLLTYKAVGATDTLSDGEEGFIPVLSRRILVTESMSLNIRGPGEKTVDFRKLTDSGSSQSLRHQSLTLQMVSQPAWYAVLSLPYLMEFPYECSEQVFNRYYANLLARHIATSDPKIGRVFETWKNTPVLDSPLEKNQELKSVVLEETPWVAEAAEESKARKKVGLLFDQNRLNHELATALRKLVEAQHENGLWPWFSGGQPSEYISLYIVSGFARLRELQIETDISPAIRALHGIDSWIHQKVRKVKSQEHPEDYSPNSIDALYLYARTFYLRDMELAQETKESFDFLVFQSRKHWTNLSRQSQAHLALAFSRLDLADTATDIMKSLKERSTTEEEMGMYWREQETSWWWDRAPVETQALMIEAFTVVSKDTEAVENCKVWLLKQKQTQNWPTTKATADAVYALLLRGKNLLSSDKLVEVSLGSTPVTPQKAEAGTGFYEERFAASEVRPQMGQVTLRKQDEGVSWGGLHWQYLEDIANVTPHDKTPLRVTKQIFIKETTASGPALRPLKSAAKIGDELVVRVVLSTDRDMEYVHLKDQRGSGVEPVNVLSGYRYQDGLSYYESTRDTASHFFIDYLRKGTYVFEYSARVQLAGDYQSGIAEVQCMYAPEFNSHSESLRLQVE